jgi:hypothetical protein
MLPWCRFEVETVRKRITLPSGDQSGSSPPLRLQGVSWRRSEPSALRMKSARRLGGSAVFRFRTSKTSCLPSGDQLGESASIANGLPPVVRRVT